jgi:hypothetical protein
MRRAMPNVEPFSKSKACFPEFFPSPYRLPKSMLGLGLSWLARFLFQSMKFVAVLSKKVLTLRVAL